MTPDDFYELCNQKKPGCIPVLKSILEEHQELDLEKLLKKNESSFLIIAHFVYFSKKDDRTYLEDLYELLGGGFNPYGSDTVEVKTMVCAEF